MGRGRRDATRPSTRWPRSARRPGSRSATGTSPRTSCGPSGWAAGVPLSRVTAGLASALGVARPAAADDRRPGRDPGRHRVGPVRLPGVVRPPAPPDDVVGLELEGVEAARRRRRASLAALTDADVVVLAPSNPFVSIGPILAVPGVRDALAGTTRAPGRGEPDRRRAGAQGPRRADARVARSRGVRARRRAAVRRPARRAVHRRAGPGPGARDRGARACACSSPGPSWVAPTTGAGSPPRCSPRPSAAVTVPGGRDRGRRARGRPAARTGARARPASRTCWRRAERSALVVAMARHVVGTLAAADGVREVLVVSADAAFARAALAGVPGAVRVRRAARRPARAGRRGRPRPAGGRRRAPAARGDARPACLAVHARPAGRSRCSRPSRAARSRRGAGRAHPGRRPARDRDERARARTGRRRRSVPVRAGQPRRAPRGGGRARRGRRSSCGGRGPPWTSTPPRTGRRCRPPCGGAVARDVPALAVLDRPRPGSRARRLAPGSSRPALPAGGRRGARSG